MCDLDTVLLGQRSRALRRDLRPRRGEPWEALGGGVHELLVANRAAEVVSERCVDVVCVLAQERDARVVERGRERRCGFGLAGGAGRSWRQLRPQILAPRKERACRRARALEAVAGLGRTGAPFLDLGGRET